MFLLFFVCLPIWSAQGVRSPGTGSTVNYAPPGGCWELNSDSLQEPETVEQSRQPLRRDLNIDLSPQGLMEKEMRHKPHPGSGVF